MSETLLAVRPPSSHGSAAGERPLPSHARTPKVPWWALRGRDAMGEARLESGEPERNDRDAGLIHRELTVLLLDVVESVLLMERDEEDTVRRWLAFLAEAEAVVSRHGGRLRKKTGDGLIAEMPDAVAAARAALALQAAKGRENDGNAHPIAVRCVVDAVRVVDAGDDLYGRDINRAVRLLTLAAPGGTVVSAGVRENLVDAVDAVLEDMGERFVRHVPEPQRVYRVLPPPAPAAAPRPFASAATAAITDDAPPMIGEDALMPTLAFVPPVVEPGVEWQGLGEILAEQVIGRLAASPDIRVISRFSTSPLAARSLGSREIGDHLAADYVVTGRIAAGGGDGAVALSLELADLCTGAVDWHEDMRVRPVEIIRAQGGVAGDVAARVARAVRRREVDLVRARPLQSLQHHTLMIGAVTLMHRLSYHDFMRAETALNALIERAGRQALPYAWLAKWHALRVQQGWSPDPARDAAAGQEATFRALETDPECTLALIMDGFVKTNLLHTLRSAEESYDRAIELCPNEPLAWLLRGTLHAFRGEGEEAVRQCARALELTPLDPHRFFYTSLAATAHLAAGDYDGAIDMARRSLRLNRMHSSTLRALGVAHWLRGDAEEAIAHGNAMRVLEPDLTVSRWLERTPAAGFAPAALWADGLRGMGIPA